MSQDKWEPGEALYSSHCDNPDCDLGELYFCCPACMHITEDLGDGWWKQDEVREGMQLVVICEHCNRSMFLIYDEEEMEFKVALQIL